MRSTIMIMCTTLHHCGPNTYCVVGNGSRKKPLFPRLESEANAHNGVAARTGFGAFDARERDFPRNRAMVRRRVTFRPKENHAASCSTVDRSLAKREPRHSRNGGRSAPAGASAAPRRRPVSDGGAPDAAVPIGTFESAILRTRGDARDVRCDLGVIEMRRGDDRSSASLDHSSSCSSFRRSTRRKNVDLDRQPTPGMRSRRAHAHRDSSPTDEPCRPIPEKAASPVIHRASLEEATIVGFPVSCSFRNLLRRERQSFDGPAPPCGPLCPGRSSPGARSSISGNSARSSCGWSSICAGQTAIPSTSAPMSAPTCTPCGGIHAVSMLSNRYRGLHNSWPANSGQSSSSRTSPCPG